MNVLNKKHYLFSARLMREKINSFDSYPFSLPIIRNLEDLVFHPSVTFIIGENGSGKSTLLEAIATALGFNPEGGTKNFNFSSRPTHSDLHKYLRLSKGYKQPKDGFFLRAESFYNVVSNIDELDEIPSSAPQIKDSYGGISLHQLSHGESFFSLMLHRFSGSGLYILDEPEAALSPTRQMAMLSRINQLVKQDSQFLIATHSPIIMAYPNAKILNIDDGSITSCEYKETEHYLVSKKFLLDHETMLSRLF